MLVSFGAESCVPAAPREAIFSPLHEVIVVKVDRLTCQLPG